LTSVVSSSTVVTALISPDIEAWTEYKSIATLILIAVLFWIIVGVLISAALTFLACPFFVFLTTRFLLLASIWSALLTLALA